MKIKRTINGLLVLLIALISSCFTEENLSLQENNKSTDLASPTGSIRAGGVDDLYCKDGLYWGDAVYFNKSKIRSFVRIEGSELREVGYQILNTLFVDLPSHHVHDHEEVLVPLPKVSCQAMLYDHLTFHWNPEGHDPLFAFGAPHFDFHFYMINLDERFAIVDPALMLIPPASQFIPPFYYGPDGPLPAMGSHWVDLLAPEFNGGTFTKAFIYGSSNTKVIFHEPMATLAHLTTTGLDETVAIRQPSQYQRDGYYPTTYRIKRDGLYTTVSLTGFVFRTMAPGSDDPTM